MGNKIKERIKLSSGSINLGNVSEVYKLFKKFVINCVPAIIGISVAIYKITDPIIMELTQIDFSGSW
jgi:hypothetical protein